MGPITCRLPSLCASTSPCRAAAVTRAAARARQPPAAPAALVSPPPTRRKLTTASSGSPPPPLAPHQQGRSRSRPSTLSSQAIFHHPHPHRRPYHSHDHPPPPEPYSPTERSILTAAYAHVAEHGFSQRALALGARDVGYLDISASGVLPDGVFSLIQWHLVTQREALMGRARVLFAGEAGEAGERLGVGRKVEMLTWERLMGNRAVIGRLQEALAIMAQPSYVPGSLKELAKLSDEIWFLVGDTSVDPSWYTKRASLSATYASAELFMTSDHSEGFVETRKFLQRRLGEVHDIGGTLRSLGQWAGFTANAGLNVLRSKGVRV